MSDIELKSDGIPVDELRASSDERSDIVLQDEDACTPLPEGNARKSKKRLREVSTEPSTPKNEESVSAVHKAEPDLPSKKNRVKPVGRSEENGAAVAAEPTSPRTPPATETELPAIVKSPAHDTKVRQIRKRVKNLTWKDGQRKLQDSATDDVDAQDEGPETADPGSDGKGGDDDTSKSVSAKSDSDKEDVPDVVKKSAEIKNDPKEGVLVSESRAELEVEDTILGSSKADAEACSGKRRRDDEDPNPREKTRITPPPDKNQTADRAIDKPKSAPTPLSGFARYAGTSSPFANAKSANVFGSLSKQSSGSTITPQPTQLSSQNDNGIKVTPSPLFGSSGFGKYAPSSSPFVQAKPTGPSVFGSSSASGSGSRSPTRSKSPSRHIHAFETYSNRSGKFAVLRPSKKQKKSGDSPVPDSGEGSSNPSGDEDGDGSEKPNKSFSEILSAKEEVQQAAEGSRSKTIYKEQEVVTGEEDEYTEFQVRAKLFHLDSTSTWKERGVGSLKLNVNEKTGKPRLVLRTDGVHRLVLNTYLFKGMGFSYGQDNRYVKFGIFDDVRPSFYTLRFSTAKHAEDLLAHVQAHTSDADLKRKKENV